ncbi:MAG: putative ATP:guanido phosphotransferase [Firmicutes bacterium ADurb.Bin506]|nr:MAG: putative ATP:guanido phosphotransferase [Firmicutes bacterium ADurb.Bin506]
MLKDGALWVSGGGPDSDIVVSSRVRLARNLAGVPFPNRAKAGQLEAVLEKILHAVESTPSIGPVEVLRLAKMSAVDRQIAVEEHLTSPQHISEPAGRALVLNRDNSMCIMINEEDHLRIQAILPGFQLDQALRLAWAADDAVEETIDYAFDAELGYLAACPTNVGTGMRASVMLHLPALAATNMIGQVLGAVSKVGVAVRGIYGEGTDAVGNLFQVSNQVTMGRAEEEIIAHLRAIVKQIMDSERAARRALMNDARMQLEDKIFRSYGLLTNARLMPSEEALRLISDVKLGGDLGLITNVPEDLLTRVSVNTMPAHIQRSAGRELSVWERDLARAAMIRERFGGQAPKRGRPGDSAADKEE